MVLLMSSYLYFYVISNIERNIDTFLDEASSIFHKYHHPNFRAAVPRDTDHTRISIGE